MIFMPLCFFIWEGAYLAKKLAVLPMSPSASPCSTPAALSTPSDLDMINGRERTPTVTLDAGEVTQEMAARLTIALLSQILYMKGQIPLCVFN